MTRTRQGTIYALIDPRDQKIRYVGKTEKTILARLAGHLATPTNPAMRVWINALSLQGLTPRIEPVATIPVGQLEAEEKRQIKLHADAGHRLLNAPYYHHHLGDLGQQRPEPERPSLTPSEPVGRAMFGRLSAARIRGQIPAWLAGLLVAVSGPIYLALALAYAALVSLVCTAPRRALLWISGVIWVLWDVGFDHAVRDLLLPHLPAVDWLLLWEQYAADPLEKLAVGFMWPYVAVSILVASMTYGDLAKRPARTPAPAGR